MRLVTWNCSRGAFARKVPLLDSLEADIAVVQECARPTHESDQCIWFGENPRQGIAVKARPPYRLIRVEPLKDVPKFMFPVQVEGPVSFTMLVVWSKRDKYAYVEAVVRGVQMYRDLILTGPTVVVGDFNSNAIWDSDHPTHSNHSALVNQLGELGLISCYHHFHNECHGQETGATLYFTWKKEKPFHIDYCFAPTAWAPRLSMVEVGSYEEWRKHSDHRPLLVEFEPSPVAS